MSSDFDMEEIRQIFVQESLEGLGVMEAGLLELDPGSADPEVMNSIFRAAHSIKGGSATFGFMEIADFTHHAETLLDQMRRGQRAVTDDAVQALLQSVDCIRGMITELAAGRPIDTGAARTVEAVLQALLSTAGPDAQPEPADTTGPTAPAAGWQVVFRPFPGIFASANDPLRIFRELRRLGPVAVRCLGADALRFASLDPEACQLGWELRIATAATRDAIAAAFDWVESECDLEIVPLATTVDDQPTTAPDLPDASPTVSAPTPSAPTASAGKTSATTAATPPTHPGTSPEASSIRVSIDKIDQLINLVGELVITQSMLSRFGDDFDLTQLDQLREGLTQLARSTRELQQNAMQIRMLPIRSCFARFPRLVHDLSRKLGKQVELTLSGEDTELDKTVLEKIADPLVHLVRNSLDHGLETPDVRTAAGKAATGRLELSARYEGGSVIIEVRDDGAGINRAKVLAKARKNGLVGPDEELSEDRINNLIFSPGFSTTEVVSDLSGRGVGLDVVRRNIQDLGGHVLVESAEGQGCVFRVRLPLTLAIMDGQLARVGKETYIFPLLSMVETIQVQPGRISRMAGRAEVCRVRDSFLPVIRLGRLFDVAQDDPDGADGLMVVAETDGERVGIMVDDLLGQQQVVIKSLQANYRAVSGFTGATILGDGTVALILDVPALVDVARAQGALQAPVPPASEHRAAHATAEVCTA